MEAGESDRGWSEDRSSKKCGVGVGTVGGGDVNVSKTIGDVAGSSTGAIAERGRFARGGSGGGGGGGGGDLNFFGGRPGVGGVNKKGGGRPHYSVTTGGADGLSVGAAVTGLTRDAGIGHHREFGGGDEVFKYLVGYSGVVGKDIGGTGPSHHSGVTGGDVGLVGGGGVRHGEAMENK